MAIIKIKQLDGKILSTYILPGIIALITFNIGLSLKFRAFKLIFKNPKALIVGLFCQIILLPLIAFAIAYFSNLPVEFKIGILLIAICPSGATSNLITYLLKGNVALSISLTTINSIIILITIPTTLYFGIKILSTQDTHITLPFFDTVGNVFLMIILPVIAGILFNRWSENGARKTENILKYVSIFLLAVVFSFAILLNKNGDKSLINYFWEVTPYTLLLNLSGMFLGLLASKLFKFSKDILITIPIEVGIQNSSLAITLAISASFLNTPLIAVPATVYGMFSFFSVFLFAYLIKKFAKE